MTSFYKYVTESSDTFTELFMIMTQTQGLT